MVTSTMQENWTEQRTGQDAQPGNLGNTDWRLRVASRMALQGKQTSRTRCPEQESMLRIFEEQQRQKGKRKSRIP